MHIFRRNLGSLAFPSPIKWIRRARPALALTLALSALPLAFPNAPLYAQTAANPETITSIRVIGNRRIPKESVLARLFSHPGDAYDPLIIERDFNSLWNTGYFEDVRIEREDTPAGVVLDVIVREKPNIRDIKYNGLNTVSQSDLLDRFKKEKVGLTVESQYDPTRIKRAEAVIKQLLSEHGHQFATIKTEVKTIPPASVNVIFNIKEGPVVKVGKISFQGNRNVPSRDLRAAMKNTRPIGIPHSLIFENLFARTYDATKLEEDSERVRQAYRDRGYYRANVGEPATRIHNRGGINIFTFRPRRGKVIDIRLPVEEGTRYRLGGINFTGVKANINVKALRAQFPIKDGDIFNGTLIFKGLQQLQKAYGTLGYVNFVAVPTPRFDEAKQLLYLDVDIDEGKPFYVSRIEIQGNTVTRDKVIRRELLLEEGQVYNSKLWETSLLRLNQLNYFETLRVDQDSEVRQNQDDATVDLLLKVREKGKNSIGLNGGLSGQSGAFLGINYQTNNFLGLGETLDLQASLGDLARNLSFGFTEPYLKNRPLSLGFQVFTNKYDFNASKATGVSGAGVNLSQAQQALIQNYNQSSTGLTVSASYALRRSFRRVGITYALSRSSIQAFSQASNNLFQALNFRSGIQGQNALNGIITSSLSPSFSYSTIGNPYQPHTGKSFQAAMQFAGVGGNVRYFSPLVEYKQFIPIKGLRFNPLGHNVFGYRFQVSYVAGFGGDVAPPANRFYSGGESEIRGFDVRSATPYAFIPTKVNFVLTNPDGSPVPKDPANPELGNVTVPLPVFSIASVGGDANVVNNIEYRIPIAGPVTFAFFNDFGLDMVVVKSQLKQSVQGIGQLNSALYGCPVLTNGVCGGGQAVNFDRQLQVISGTGSVPRDSFGGEIQVILPIVNAPFRLYYAYNPLRLFKQVPAPPNLTSNFPDGRTARDALFPAGGAGDFSYGQAVAFYGSHYQLREPRKTFRLTVSTTF